MNITTGGPHLLLFERDQQLANLLNSELQLAGYECHTARTAVEVFDAIARHPIQLVLVNLAQAAASRREFWVALDTQRHGRGVQVFTFLCTNIGSYGPKDPDDQLPSATIDMEVDGMLGLMSLADAIRNRIPNANTTTSTVPRMPKAPTPSSVSNPKLSPLPPSNSDIPGGTLLRTIPPSDAPFYQPAIRSGVPTGSQPAANPNAPVSPQQLSPASVPPTPVQENNVANHPPYADRIRAVLYPNQQTWSSSSPAQLEPRFFQENQVQSTQGSPMYAPRPNPMPYTQPQTEMSPSNESGLDQLSQLIQQYQTAGNNQIPPTPIQQPQPVPMQPPRSTPMQPPLAPPSTLFNNTQAQRIIPPFGGTHTAAPQPPTTGAQANNTTNNTIGITNYGISPQSTLPENPTIGAQPMRPAPIQDLPSERPGVPESSQKTEMPRPGYAAQQVLPTVPPLASMTMPPQSNMPSASRTMPAVQVQPVRGPDQPSATTSNETIVEEKPAQEVASHGTSQPLPQGQPADPSTENLDREKKQPEINTPAVEALHSRTMKDQATLINIMESLPPMPPVQAASSAAQPHVLNGRATRTLGSVLLAGHLVPEDRLEVAQHIQRMLQGVDLNYQLGEILLMFKLLTPDQLMAASLVSYGMISTQQISALGRIRQELHAIGLQYDLENLLILFRILTPEQIREARSSWQS